MRSALERYAGALSVANADLGSRVTLQVCIETLHQWGHEDAASLLEEIGERQVAQAFAQLAWNDNPPSGDADGTNVNHSARTPKET